MKFRFPVRTVFSVLVAGLVLTSLAAPAPAGDLPKRKAGLWEISMRMDGVPNMGPIQQCIDQNTDNVMQQKAKNEKQQCSVVDVKASGNKVYIHSVCKVEGSTATSDGVFEGSFETNYKGTIKTRYVPPMQGMSESNMTQEARWLGPCKPGQKPGDVIMSRGGNMNINEMMNDPKFREMMMKHQQGQ